MHMEAEQYSEHTSERGAELRRLNPPLMFFWLRGIMKKHHYPGFSVNSLLFEMVKL